MDSERVGDVLIGVIVVAAVATLAVDLGLVELPGKDAHDLATVTVTDGDGTELATVEARVADTYDERYQGLSNTDSLANGSGMLFVYDDEGHRTFVMREMNYGLDMIFVGADGRITAIEGAPPPGPGEDGENIKRSGRAKWVLEVPRGWADARGIESGDRVEIEYDS